MRLCNWIVVDEKGERPLGSSTTLECSGLAYLRFETAFFLRLLLAILWSDDEDRTLLTESMTVNRDTMAVFLPIHSYLSTSTLKSRICESTQCFKTLSFSIAHPARSRLALYAFVRKEQNRYFALYDWLRRLPFEERTFLCSWVAPMRNWVPISQPLARTLPHGKICCRPTCFPN